ncbi:uncharacterized protein CPUR_01663 [Claviceps purpurea 20.1]|uniref:Uncharacterized protein n=1 Tax=Claviceps purpurea (strain 20.1) TaxID=1111077 RepID=M1WBC0_CLAP2|nr:uncharacterized protein CPUR_01663 [Claviceps purpurea 20.1]
MERPERRCHRIRLDQAGEKTSSDFAVTGLAVNGYGVTANTAQQIGTAILPCRTGSKLIYLTLPHTTYDANATCNLVSLSQLRANGTKVDYVKNDFVLTTDLGFDLEAVSSFCGSHSSCEVNSSIHTKD